MSSEGPSKSISLQKRDIGLLHDLYVSRIMTLAHIAALHFDSRLEAAKKRVQKLKRAKFIRERPRRVNEPAILFLSRKAFHLLSHDGHLANYPPADAHAFQQRVQVSDLTVHHELAVMDVKAAIVAAIHQQNCYACDHISTWPLLHAFEIYASGGRRMTVKPDGFIHISEELPNGHVVDHRFFLEVDRSTEQLDVLARRCDGYQEFYRSGGFAHRYGYSRGEYKQAPFRVLIVCKSAERRDNISERLLRNMPPIMTLVWLTTFAELMADPLGAIWIRPKDLLTGNSRSALFATSNGQPNAPLKS